MMSSNASTAAASLASMCRIPSGLHTRMKLPTLPKSSRVSFPYHHLYNSTIQLSLHIIHHHANRKRSLRLLEFIFPIEILCEITLIMIDLKMMSSIASTAVASLASMYRISSGLRTRMKLSLELLNSSHTRRPTRTEN